MSHSLLPNIPEFLVTGTRDTPDLQLSDQLQDQPNIDTNNLLPANTNNLLLQNAQENLNDLDLKNGSSTGHLNDLDLKDGSSTGQHHLPPAIIK